MLRLARVPRWPATGPGGGGVIDLVPLGECVLVATPDTLTPLADATEITITSDEEGRMTGADGFGSFGESVRRVFANDDSPVRLWLAGEEYVREEALVA